ncbi:hypothetical protein Stube_27580 [Streptomyces tubercidicus]|uniref:DUF397 domain-containing protein n=1 Tax=Streptomyces tubercidicus TaxID=47759 RepID=A0A640UUN4_9ACTN|nr:hypothetical protein Stube_27580 [Streptomyces tubercidicus]
MTVRPGARMAAAGTDLPPDAGHGDGLGDGNALVTRRMSADMARRGDVRSGPAHGAAVFSTAMSLRVVSTLQRPNSTSTYSNPDGGQCIEVSDDLPGLTPVRDSKAPHTLPFRCPYSGRFSP